MTSHSIKKIVHFRGCYCMGDYIHGVMYHEVMYHEVEIQ